METKQASKISAKMKGTTRADAFILLTIILTFRLPLKTTHKSIRKIAYYYRRYHRHYAHFIQYIHIPLSAKCSSSTPPPPLTFSLLKRESKQREKIFAGNLGGYSVVGSRKAVTTTKQRRLRLPKVRSLPQVGTARQQISKASSEDTPLSVPEELPQPKYKNLSNNFISC